MNIAVAIPWRPTPAREAGHGYVVDQYRRLLPGAPIIDADTDHEPFNRAAARNHGVRLAERAGADVVVISDADCVFATPASLIDAITAADDGRLHLPYTAQHYCTEAETARILEHGPDPLPGHPGNGACYVITPDAYWAAGGSDERFIGWGGEDDGLVSASSALIGLRRHTGTVLSLWHADEHRPVGSDEHRPNKLLADRYLAAARSPRRMRALIAERT